MPVRVRYLRCNNVLGKQINSIEKLRWKCLVAPHFWHGGYRSMQCFCFTLRHLSAAHTTRRARSLYRLRVLLQIARKSFFSVFFLERGKFIRRQFHTQLPEPSFTVIVNRSVIRRQTQSCGPLEVVSKRLRRCVDAVEDTLPSSAAPARRVH